MKRRYLFVVGSTPQLSIAELRAFYPDLIIIDPEIVEVSIDSESFDAQHMLRTLGGTTKIAQVVGKLTACTKDELLPYLLSEPAPVHFGLSVFGETRTTISLLKELKDDLRERGISATYNSVGPNEQLSTVVIQKKNITEFIIIKNGDSYIVAKTLAVQPFEVWAQRDRGRPFGDPKRGMLPPKVARMMVNIAHVSASSEKNVLVDPFCGMGTIVAEAWLTGWNVIGSDQSEEVVVKAHKNLEWLIQQSMPRNNTWKIYQSDATHISEKISKDSVDVIVTEPFMGDTSVAVDKASQDIKHVKNIIKGLEKLYIGCLKDWKNILKKDGKVIITLPEYSIRGHVFFVKKVIDICENLGYTVHIGPIEYSRPQAIVKRKIYVLHVAI